MERVFPKLSCDCCGRRNRDVLESPSSVPSLQEEVRCCSLPSPRWDRESRLATAQSWRRSVEANHPLLQRLPLLGWRLLSLLWWSCLCVLRRALKSWLFETLKVQTNLTITVQLKNFLSHFNWRFCKQKKSFLELKKKRNNSFGVVSSYKWAFE